MIKKLWKSAAVKVWSIVSFVVIILFLVVTILSTTAFYELFNLVMPGGGPRAVYAEGIEPYTYRITTIKPTFTRRRGT